MATWKEDYFAALEARDETEKANIEIYEACSNSQLAYFAES